MVANHTYTLAGLWEEVREPGGKFVVHNVSIATLVMPTDTQYLYSFIPL